MAFTKKALKAMGITDEQVESIFEMHTEAVDSLKADVARYKLDADKLPAVQKELETLKTEGDGGYKKRYEDEHTAFESYKSEITAKEIRAAKEKAARSFYESKGIKGENLTIAMRGSSSEIDGIELDGDKIKDSTALDSLVSGTFSSLVSKGTSFDWTAPVGAVGGKTTVNDTMNALIRGAVK